MGMTLHEAIEVLKLYQYGVVNEMAPHSFDLNDETVKTILAALEKPQKYKPPDGCLACAVQNDRADGLTRETVASFLSVISAAKRAER